MCDLNCGNLIDLSLEDEVPCSNIQPTTDGSVKLSADAPDFITSTWRKRDSLENNPFDRAQKLVDRLYDPFDIVENEACLKAHQAYKASAEVKLGNLLSLSDDNLLNEEKKPTTPLITEVCGSDLKMEELDLESPPVLLMMNEKHTTDSMSTSETDTTPKSSSETTTSAKLKKNMEYRKRLLKLSISNASFSAPIIFKKKSDFEDILGSPVSSMLSRGAEFEDDLLAAESPLKLVEDEDFADSDKNFEADLEMLKIPILNNLPSPQVDQIQSIKSIEDSTPLVNNISDHFENGLPNLEVIRAKLKAKKEEINSNHELEISALLENLKTLISSGEMVDKNKRQQATDLLESLSLALKPSNVKEVTKESESPNVPNQQIKREGTFDMDLQKNNTDNQALVQELPNCMVSSTATYDGESSHEKQNLNLPEISPLSPQSLPSNSCCSHKNVNDCADHLQSGVNGVMEQLSKLLINNSAENFANCNNPTFIVVMNTNPLNQSNTNYSNQNPVDAKLRSAFVADYLENSNNDGSPVLTNTDSISRRRSQSLSIHDKIKVVNLPLKPPTLLYKQNQNIALRDESINTTPPSGDKETGEFKTPIRLRRNSFSSGTPYTPQLGTRRTGICSENRSHTRMRQTQTLETHHEGQYQGIVGHLSVSSNNFLAFKPDLKKKSKLNTESIMKSSGPLKATIPVKKVAHMLKKSSATPEKLTNTKIIMPRTPIPPKGNSRLGEGVCFPNASSTPSAFSSPLRRTTGPVNKPRYSYMSASPSPKSSLNNSSASLGLKRRTISEFKAKSPLKPRVSSADLASGASASSYRLSAGTARLSVSAGARVCKTPVKTTTANTTSLKPTSRLSYRASLGGSLMSTRNKENKRP